MKRKLVPDFILEKCLNNKLSGRFKAYTMFLDISGFTAMTQDLMKYGKEGVEILSRIINDIFTPAINEVYNNGGFISSFAGDAFMSVFRLCRAEYALNAAYAIQNLFEKCGSFETKFGNYMLRVRIGLSAGNLQYRIIDAGHQLAYYFKGRAIDGCCNSENLAQSMQIVADNIFLSGLSREVCIKKIDDTHYLIHPGKLFLPKAGKQKEPVIPEGMQKRFIPEAVLELKAKGEFREVVSCFISFSPDRGYNDFIKMVIKKCYSYGGYFNRVDFGDKGPVILILFGAPSAREKLYQRACDFILALRALSRLRFRAGITAETAFAGFVGSEKQSEYTALGGNVNLAARFMTNAGWSEILTDRNISESMSGSFVFNLKGYYDLKGFSVKKRAYLLKEKKLKDYDSGTAGHFIGRDAEAGMLRKILQPIFQKRFGGLIYIDGPAGIGKSEFVRHFAFSLSSCRFLYLQCDEILRKSFNPFIYLLKKYFGQNDYNTERQNSLTFRRIYKDLTGRCPDHSIKKELERTESVIAALTGLAFRNSLYSELNEKDRYDNTIYAVKNFLISLALIGPVVLVLEDAHWIDSDSKNLIKMLVRNVGKYPFAILVICRTQYEGARFEILDPRDMDASTARLEIMPFSREKIITMVTAILGKKKIPGDTLDYIWDKSRGNPFYAGQILMYLHEKGMLGENLTNKHDILPSSISQIIMARIDRLSTRTKEIIKSASVLGMEFALLLLKKLLARVNIIIDDNEYQNQLQIGYREQIWEAISGLFLIFKHTLIRDSVYEMQLHERTRKLHNIAGLVMEELYSSRLENYYEELVNHFVRAENAEKARFYLWLAAEQAKSRFFNEKAVEYYEILESYYQKDYYNLSKILLNKSHVLEIAGKIKKADEAAGKALNYANNSGDYELIAKCMNKLGWLYGLQNESVKAKDILFKALKIAENIDSKEMKGMLTGNLGKIYMDESNYAEALEYFYKDLEIGRLIDPDNIDVPINNIGLVYTHQGSHNKAIECFKEALSIIERKNDKSGMARTLCNIGMAYHYQGNLKAAAEYYEKSIKISDECGIKRISGVANGNMGSIYFMLDDYDKALQYYNKRLEIAQELGDKFGASSAVGNIGVIYTTLGKFDEGMELFRKKLDISRAIGNKNSECNALSDIAINQWYRKDYSEALKTFDEAIRTARKINLRYHLCEFLSLKSEMMYETGRAGEAEKEIDEAYTIASEFGRKDIIFNMSLLRLSIDKDTKGLKRLLSSTEKAEDKAKINHALWKVTNDRNTAGKTIKMYKELFEKIPKFTYKKAIEEIEKALGRQDKKKKN